MSSNVTTTNRPSRLRARSSKLGQQLALYLFVALLAVNAISFVPSYVEREQDLLHDIEYQGIKGMAVLLIESATDLEKTLRNHSAPLFSRTPIVGFVVYRESGQVVAAAGEPVERRPSEHPVAPANTHSGHFFDNHHFDRVEGGTRFDAIWTPQQLGAPYIVAARLDASEVGHLLVHHTIETIVWVLAMAAVMTIVLLIALNKIVLKPVLSIHQSIRGAGDDLGRAHEWVVETPSYGEIGELTKAVNQILRNVSENFRTGQKQNEEILQEASRRLLAEEEVKRKHRQLIEAIEAFPGGFAVFDASDRLTLCNQTWKEFYPEIGDKVVPGTKFEDIMRGVINADRRAGYYNYGAFWLEKRLAHHRNGTTDIEKQLRSGRWMRVTERRTEDGGVIGILTDITERKAAEAERADLQAQFYQAQKNDALGTLAGGIAHDFNNLLAIILGNAKLLETDLPVDAPGREELDAISGAGNRAKDLVKQILSFARRDSARFEHIDLREITDEALSLMRATLPKSIVTEVSLGEAAPIFGDPTQMHQIIMNLCINARDAIGDTPGRLFVELEKSDAATDWPRELDAQVEGRESEQRVIFRHDRNRSNMWMGAPPAGSDVRLSVSDNGSGVEPDAFEKIFDPFFTTKDIGKGTGLGLAAVQGIIRSHGGAIHVSTKLGEGTKFEILMPRQDGEVEVMPDEPAADGQGTGRILVIDDEDQIVSVLKKSLERQGYDVTGMTDPTLALKALEDEPDFWDAVITDFNMPRLTGVQMAQSIHALRPQLPVILCSGSIEGVPEQDLKSQYYSAVIEKPVQTTEMFRAIQRCLAENRGEGDQ